jgi:hypothetical protein
MSNAKINTIANIVLPVVSIALTVVLFLMFRPEEPTSLFYLNLAYTVLLEAIFFGYFNLLHSKTEEVSTPFYAIFGVFALYYIVIGLGCMLLYSLALMYFVPIKFYVAALIVLTLLWIILSVLTAQTDSNYKQTANKLNDQQHTLSFYAQKIALLTSRYEKLCAEKGIHYQTESNNSSVLDKLKGKIEFLTPNILSSETAHLQLNVMLDKCEAIIEETEAATADQLVDLEKKMQRFVNNSIDELNMLKNITRN